MNDQTIPELKSVTIVVVPRDRFGSVGTCVQSILDNTPAGYRIVVLDFGYSKKELQQLRSMVGQTPLDIVWCGRTIPMLAFANYLPKITSRYVAWVDNDTYATADWMTAMLARAAEGARVVMPMTLEREGLDVDTRRLAVRNHVSHSELRQVQVNGTRYVLDYKPYRRADPKDIPPGPHTIDFFELHTFFAETEVLKQLDYPAMVVREHVDIGIQLHRKGIDIIGDTDARVHFDNIHERPTWADLKFFFFRWDQKLIDQAHDLFFQRWGYRFYNEQFIKNWAFRRKVFSVCRFLWLPGKLADFASKVMAKLFAKPIPAELRADPLAKSERVFTSGDAQQISPLQTQAAH